ncbi:MAG: HD-GYP domain-containing protein [Clostridiales bacterium]|nr:HD-GYP domain-containing protein [Clostridiales bacterium]
MKRIRVNELLPGMIIAEDVLNYNNQMVLSKGTVLTDKTIMKLEFYSVYTVRIEDSVTVNPNASEDAGISYMEYIRNGAEYQQFKQEFDQELETFKSSIHDIVTHNSDVNFDQMLSDTLSLLDTGGTKVFFFDMLHSMRIYDDQTYAHSINVAMICNVFAEWLKMSEEDVQIATLCGLCHDVGKITIPETIMRKKAPLTKEELILIQSHPRQGYKLLMPYPIDERIKLAALLHHERYDGSGYPGHLKGSQINLFAQMVSIADVYDAMTSPRIYREAICPFTVVELFETEGYQKYEPQLITTFLSRIVNTYLLNSVRLSNGLVGKIVYINPNKLSRPTIQCGKKFINLAERPELSIVSLV